MKRRQSGESEMTLQNNSNEKVLKIKSHTHSHTYILIHIMHADTHNNIYAQK